MTTAQRNRLLDLAAQMRAVAIPVGVMHAWWDDIIDIQCVLTGREPALKTTTEERIAESERMLIAYHEQRARDLATHLDIPYVTEETVVLDTYMDPATCADRLWREYTKHGRLIVATDWDETIQAFHGGSTHEMVIALLQRCSALGFHIYIFTASNPERWPAMKAYARERGIAVADGVNVNPIPLPFGNWGKPYWNVLVDDRAGLASAYAALLSVVERAEATAAPVRP